MKRIKLIKYISSNGCELLREGGNHSWRYNSTLNKRSAIPRHREIDDRLAKKIFKDLGLKPY